MAIFVVVSTPEASTARQMLPRAAEHLLAASRGTQRPLEHLERLRHARWLLDHAESLLIEAARSEGASWARIGRARGTSRQNERQADGRRRAAAAMDPLDRWLDGQRARVREERRQRVG